MAGGFFHEMRQNANIGAAKADAQNAQRSAENAQDALRKLEKKVESLLLLNKALWSFISEKNGLSEADLLNRYQEIANSGGSASAQACSNCSRPVGKAQARCMYCGTEKTVTSIFDTI